MDPRANWKLAAESPFLTLFADLVFGGCGGLLIVLSSKGVFLRHLFSITIRDPFLATSGYVLGSAFYGFSELFVAEIQMPIRKCGYAILWSHTLPKVGP